VSAGKLYSRACERNREPILEVLLEVLPDEGTMLEVASGTGMHAAHFVPRLRGWTWQPTDHTAEALASVEAWRGEVGDPRLRPPVALDVTRRPWPVAHADAIFNANMIHIAPWEVAEGLFAGAGEVLRAGAPLLLYGPFKRNGAHTAPSNAAFDASLRTRDPRWGVRDLEAVEGLAARSGLHLEEVRSLPANNLLVVFWRR
jgi:hypothetical protein